MIYSADLIFPGDSPPFRDGWIQMEGDRIVATGSASGLPADAAAGDVRRFPGCAILPGLVNLHCHLELTSLHDRLDRGKPFPTWVQQLRGYTAGLDDENYRHAAQEGVRQLLAGGCTTVLDVGNTGNALPVLAAGPLRAYACVETLGIDPGLAEHRFQTAVARAAKTPSTDRFFPGVAPHAAYSTSPDLLRKLIAWQQTRGLPVTIHAAESREETECFATSTGPLADYCRRIYPAAPRHTGATPIRWLEANGALPDGALIIHGNTLDDADMDILARRRATVVHCPSSHKFFGHPRFPYEALRERGINVGLGTDSLASGDSLSMLEQMRLFAENHPDVPVEEIVAMATINGARALGLSDVGLLKAGWRTDFIAVQTETGTPASGAHLLSDLFGSTARTVTIAGTLLP
jgi:aminodeoxyfutalosine deaminase